MTNAHSTREAILSEAFAGRLVRQHQNDLPASVSLEHIQTDTILKKYTQEKVVRVLQPESNKRSDSSMRAQPLSSESLIAAWKRINRRVVADRLFEEAGCSPEHVVQFYDILRATPEVRVAFEKTSGRNRHPRVHHIPFGEKHKKPKGRFRLVELWLEDFKNLKDYSVCFNPAQGFDVVLGWNGTGKSNLLEVLVIIFRDLHEWWEKIVGRTSQ